MATLSLKPLIKPLSNGKAAIFIFAVLSRKIAFKLNAKEMYECPTKADLATPAVFKMELFLTIVNGFLPLTIITNINAAGF